jgi:hypothetical protein
MLSRQGLRSKDAATFIAEMHANGVHVEAPACDITDAASLQKTLKLVSETLPPIKGCIQAVMVLRVSLHSKIKHGKILILTRTRFSNR